MSNPVFLGIDIGSASVRAGLFDAHGQRLAFAVRSIKQFHPKPLFVEQSSADIWAQTCAAVREELRGRLFGWLRQRKRFPTISPQAIAAWNRKELAAGIDIGVW